MCLMATRNSYQVERRLDATHSSSVKISILRQRKRKCKFVDLLPQFWSIDAAMQATRLAASCGIWLVVAVGPLEAAEQAARYPRFAKGTPYKEVQETLRALRWLPVLTTTQDVFLWRRGNTVIQIYVEPTGVNEADALMRMRCRTGCQ
jgi:hypothetical protein